MRRAVAVLIDSSERMRINNGHILGGTAFLVCGLGIFAPLALAPLICVAALAATVVHYRKLRQWPRPSPTIVGLFIAFAVVGVLSAIWSIDRGDTFVGLTRALPLFVAGGLLVGAARHLTQEEIRTFVRLFAAGAAVALCLLAIERFAGAPIRHLTSPDLPEGLVRISFNRGASVTALWVWPVAFLAWYWRKWAGIVLWLAVFALIALHENASAMVALAFGGAACLAAYVAPRVTPIAIAALCGAIVLAVPLIPDAIPAPATVKENVGALPRSAYHRLLIWRFTADRIGEKPLLGWGLRTSRDIPGGAVKLDAAEPALPLHPHNGHLQLWLELGVPGALLGATLVVSILLMIRRSQAPPAARAAAVGMAVAAFLMVGLSYGMWQSWWLAALWMTAAFMTVMVRTRTGVDGACSA